MDNQRGILFTGNIGLGSADAVFNALGEIVGARAKPLDFIFGFGQSR